MPPFLVARIEFGWRAHPPTRKPKRRLVAPTYKGATTSEAMSSSLYLNQAEIFHTSSMNGAPLNNGKLLLSFFQTRCNLVPPGDSKHAVIEQLQQLSLEELEHSGSELDFSEKSDNGHAWQEIPSIYLDESYLTDSEPVSDEEDDAVPYAGSSLSPAQRPPASSQAREILFANIAQWLRSPETRRPRLFAIQEEDEDGTSKSLAVLILFIHR